MGYNLGSFLISNSRRDQFATLGFGRFTNEDTLYISSHADSRAM